MTFFLCLSTILVVVVRRAAAVARVVTLRMLVRAECRRQHSGASWMPKGGALRVQCFRLNSEERYLGGFIQVNDGFKHLRKGLLDTDHATPIDCVVAVGEALLRARARSEAGWCSPGRMEQAYSPQ